MQTMDFTLSTQPKLENKRNRTKIVLDVLCLTIFPLIYVLGKALLYSMHLMILEVHAMIPSPGTI